MKADPEDFDDGGFGAQELYDDIDGESPELALVEPDSDSSDPSVSAQMEAMMAMSEMELGTDVMTRLNTDLRSAAKMMSVQEARYLVNLYYAMQGFRKRAGSQTTSNDAPGSVLSWVFKNSYCVEKDIKSALGVFAAEYAAGQWLQGIDGIGPVISAGFLSTLDVRGCPTVGHWWRFAGLDPTMKWYSPSESEKVVKSVMGTDKLVTDDHIIQCADVIGRRVEGIRTSHKMIICNGTEKKMTRSALVKTLSMRPWNAKLKVLTYHAGSCFIRRKNAPESYYGKLFTEYWENQIRRNKNGDFKQQAEVGFQRVGKGTLASKHYKEGRLPPGHILARSRRWVAKIFMSHFHDVCYRDYFKKDPPVPFVFSDNCADDHRHFIEVPKVDIKPKAKKLRSLWSARR